MKHNSTHRLDSWASKIRRLAGAVAITTLAAITCEPATAAIEPPPFHVTQPTLVNALPTSKTPHALDGSVKAVAVVGDTVVMAGNFTKAANPDRTAVDRKYILAYDKATGKIRETFKPVLDSDVWTLLASKDGKSVYVGGHFKTIDGKSYPKLARLNIADGKPIAFNPQVNGVVTTMAFVGNRLWIGGIFSNVQGQSLRVAAVDPNTAKLDPKANVAISGSHRGIETGRIWRIESSPDGRNVVIIGNFNIVDGQNRNQIVKLDIAADGNASVSTWSTRRYEAHCASYSDYMRDVSFSPDGKYFAVANIGFNWGDIRGTLCDSANRWENNGQANASPTWIAYSGGDSVYTLEATGTAIYVGGHYRYLNNGAGTRVNFCNPGCTQREALSALDPLNGVPLSWNPGRDRGQAVWQLLATPDGLFVASDTDRIARYLYRGRIAFFPLAGGLTVPKQTPQQLPVTFNQYVPKTATKAAIVQRSSYDGATSKAVGALVPPADLATITGSFMANGKLYTTHSNGTFRQRTFDGKTFGQPVAVQMAGNTFAADIPNLRGLTLTDGWLYYSLGRATTLYRRAFSLETQILGDVKFAVAQSATATLHYGYMRGMAKVGDYMYFIEYRTGRLMRGKWSTAGIDAATVAVVDPNTNWSSSFSLWAN